MSFRRKYKITPEEEKLMAQKLTEFFNNMEKKFTEEEVEDNLEKVFSQEIAHYDVISFNYRRDIAQATIIGMLEKIRTGESGYPTITTNGSVSSGTGSNLASASAWPTSVDHAYYGGPTNMWGTSLTRANLQDSTFGMQIADLQQQVENLNKSLEIQADTVDRYIKTIVELEEQVEKGQEAIELVEKIKEIFKEEDQFLVGDAQWRVERLEILLQEYETYDAKVKP